MRKILFRGKQIYSGEWVEGYYAAEPYTKNTYNYGYILENEKDLFAKKVWLVDSRTVGQYTGLTDKNGTKIFENDICRYDNGEEFKDKDRFSNYVVQWDSVNTRYVVVDEWNCEDILDEFFSRHAVVIGNIYDDNLEELANGR